LKTIAGDYDLEWCRWRVLGSNPKKKKEIFNPNPKGYIHGSVILKNTIYAFFGPDESKPAAVPPCLFSQCTRTTSRPMSGNNGEIAICPRRGTALA
jgi:hypothetical protein